MAMCYNVGKRIVAILGVASLLVVTIYGVVSAQSADADLETVRGTVERLTTAPKGEVDGAKLDDGTVVHWPPHLERRFTAIVAKGDRIEATGRFETTPDGDKVLEVRSVTNLKTRISRSNDDDPPPPPPGKKGKGKGKKGKERFAGPFKTVSGVVERLTTAPKGEVDGAELANGTVVHWPPHLERRFTAIVAKGDRIEATGRFETTPDGDKVLEVRSVTNLKTKASRINEDAPLPPEDIRRQDANTPADVEQRLRSVEEKLDRLIKEVKRLRRD